MNVTQPVARNMINLKGMERCLKLTIFVAIVALWSNSACYARCLVSPPATASSPAHAMCHHSSGSKKDAPAACHAGHNVEIATPEVRADLAQTSLHAVPVTCLQSGAQSDILILNQGLHSPPARTLPPGKPLFLALSVLLL